MNRALASIGIAAAVICGSATPALAADNPVNAKSTNISSVTAPAQQSGSKAVTPKPSESMLAKTGTNAEIAATLVIMTTAIGAVVYITSSSRKDDN